MGYLWSTFLEAVVRINNTSVADIYVPSWHAFFLDLVIRSYQLLNLVLLLFQVLRTISHDGMDQPGTNERKSRVIRPPQPDNVSYYTLHFVFTHIDYDFSASNYLCNT